MTDRLQLGQGTLGANRAPESKRAFVEGEHYRIEDRGYTSPCWVWQRWLDPQGYGRTTNEFAHRRAHREAWAQVNGKIPEGNHVHHCCEVRECVNPTHLETHTHSEHLAMHKQEDSPMTWDQVREIRRRAWEGETQTELAKEYGIHITSMGQIILGRSWVDPEYSPPELLKACRECGDAFTTNKPLKVFCCPEHRLRFNARKTWQRKAAA